MYCIATILHPTDFSARADIAFHLACSLARDHHARLIVLHVKPPLVHAEHVERAPEGDERERRWHERLRELQVSGPRLALEYRETEGPPDGEIVRFAREQGCDLIVMGTHGRGGLVRLLLGSVADKVLRTAPCPVMTVRAPLPEYKPAATSAGAADEPLPALGPLPARDENLAELADAELGVGD